VTPGRTTPNLYPPLAGDNDKKAEEADAYFRTLKKMTSFITIKFNRTWESPQKPQLALKQ